MALKLALWSKVKLGAGNAHFDIFLCNLLPYLNGLLVLQVANRKDNFYRVISDNLDCIEKTVSAQEDVSMKAGLYKHVVDLKDLIKVEWKKYDVS